MLFVFLVGELLALFLAAAPGAKWASPALALLTLSVNMLQMF